MRKILALFWVAFMVVAFSACGGGNVESTVSKEEVSLKHETTQEDVKDKNQATEITEENKEDSSSGIRADFKAAMDSYEEFFDKYVEIMKKYKNNPKDLSILSDYASYMGKYAQMMGEFEKWENEDMNLEETTYYIQVQGRITQKLLEVAQ